MYSIVESRDENKTEASLFIFNKENRWTLELRVSVSSKHAKALEFQRANDASRKKVRPKSAHCSETLHLLSPISNIILLNVKKKFGYHHAKIHTGSIKELICVGANPLCGSHLPSNHYCCQEESIHFHDSVKVSKMRCEIG